MEEFEKLVAFKVSMSIKIVGHSWQATCSYVKMSQVIQSVLLGQ